jgi:hypothetical protein
MAYRFTNTEKWGDAWFANLKQIEMLLWLYLCDNCDIGGFIEINYKRWANDLNSNIKTIKGACKGLSARLIYAKTNDCIYIKNFLKHQKNLPLNPENKAHIGIERRFVMYSQKFEIQSVNDFIEGASKGLLSPTGNGIGKGIDLGKVKEEAEKIKFPDFSEFLNYYNSDISKKFPIDEFVLKAKFDSWVEAGWKDGNGSKIKNWKTKLRNTVPFLAKKQSTVTPAAQPPQRFEFSKVNVPL